MHNPLVSPLIFPPQLTRSTSTKWPFMGKYFESSKTLQIWKVMTTITTQIALHSCPFLSGLFPCYSPYASLDITLPLGPVNILLFPMLGKLLPRHCPYHQLFILQDLLKHDILREAFFQSGRGPLLYAFIFTICTPYLEWVICVMPFYSARPQAPQKWGLCSLCPAHSRN